jgi:hypothetical protein
LKTAGAGHRLTANDPAIFSTEALALGERALDYHDKALGRDHSWTKDSGHVTADALDALGRTEEAKALRERYGLAGPDK